LGRIVDQQIEVRGFCLTWAWLLLYKQVTVLRIRKFSVIISRGLSCTPINVLGIIVLAVGKSPTMTWLQLCRPINVLEIRGFFHTPTKLPIKLLVIIGFLVTC
jgi:hypothetical protein